MADASSFIGSLQWEGEKTSPQAGKVGVQVDEAGRQRPPAAVKSRFPLRKGFQAGHHFGNLPRFNPDSGLPGAVPAESRREVQMVKQQSHPSLSFLSSFSIASF